MTQLNRVKPGSTIAIVAPSGYCSPKALSKAKSYLENRGYSAYVQKGLLKKYLHFSNTDDVRFSSLKLVLQDPNVEAIWALRGGSGAQRLLPNLMRLRPPKKKKVFIGFSDNSSLHYFLNQKWNWPSLHAPVLNRMILNSQPASEEKAIWDQIEGRRGQFTFKGLKLLNHIKKANIKGKVVGGNLTTLQALLGSSLAFHAKNRILFLEDVGEKPYRIDRALISMQQAGVFNSCKAIVLGDFTNCDGLKGQANITKTLNAFSDSLKIPVYKGVKAGHGKLQYPLWFNTPSYIKQNQLIVESPIK